MSYTLKRVAALPNVTLDLTWSGWQERRVMG